VNDAGSFKILLTKILYKNSEFKKQSNRTVIAYAALKSWFLKETGGPAQLRRNGCETK